MAKGERFVIAQLSDIHCGDPRYDARLMERTLKLVQDVKPDLVLIPGDLTAAGYPEEYEEAAQLLELLPRPWFVVPGNHDERNVGWRIYQRLFGDRWHSHDVESPEGRVRLVACDSSEPDLDDGELGRVRHKWIADSLRGSGIALKIVMLHHHLVAVPNTGRERNTVSDAGDVLATLAESRVDLVLSGHKHVPHLWAVNGMAIVTSGTATTWRIRGEVPPSLNVLTIAPDTIEVAVMNTADSERRVLSLPRRHKTDYFMNAETMAATPSSEMRAPDRRVSHAIR